MKINHTIMHYILGAAALAGAGAAYVHKPEVQLVPTAVTQQVTNIKVGHHDWPSLGEDKTIALGEALNTIGNKMDDGSRKKKVTLFCASTACQNIRNDIDDAFQIAWWERDFEDRFVDSEGDVGLYVGPPGKDAEALAAAFKKNTGIEAVIVPIDGIKGLGVIMGKSAVK